MVQGWYYRKAGIVHGPFSSARFRLLIESGEVFSQDHVRSTSETEWKTLKEHVEDTTNSNKPNLNHQKENLSTRQYQEIQLSNQTTTMNTTVEDDSTGTFKNSAVDSVQHNNWYCRLGNELLGPVETEFIRKLAEKQRFSNDDQIKHTKDGPWIRWQVICNQLQVPSGDSVEEINWLDLPAAYQVIRNNSSCLSQYQKPEYLKTHFAPEKKRISSLYSTFQDHVSNSTELLFGKKRFLLGIAIWFFLNIVAFILFGYSTPQKDLYARSFPTEAIDQEVFDVYQTYYALWQKAEKLKVENGNNQEWRSLSVEARKTLVPIVSKLSKTENPAKITLYRIGRYQLYPLIQRRFQTERGDYAHWHLRRSMEDIKRALEHAKFQE